MHLDDEILAMVALGEHELDGEAREHLEQCRRCSMELDAIRRLVTVGRAAADVELVAPGPGVWQAIHSELALTDAVAQDPLSAPAQPESRTNAPRILSQPAPDAEAENSAGDSARITPIQRARGGSGFGRWWPMAAAALFVGIIAGVIGAQLWPTASEQVLAEAALEPFPNWQASGSAQLAELDGVRELIVDLEAPSGGLREVWLINPETSGLLSLGLLDGTRGQFRIPTDVDLAGYSVVDISEEPNDGDPGHSGDSIVRGELRDA